MRIEVSIAKTTALPNGALEALNNELAKRIAHYYPERENQVTVRYAAGNNLSVIGGLKEDKDRISEILQETGKAPTTGLSTTKPPGLLTQNQFAPSLCFCRVAPAFISAYN